MENINEYVQSIADEIKDIYDLDESKRYAFKI